MENILENIEKQIASCKELLDVFRNERQVYASKSVIAIKEVNEILGKKRQIMTVFETQQSIMKQLATFQAQNKASDEGKQKKLIRELATVLEQLLVIDQENEILLKELLSSRKNNSSRQSPNRMRPALKTQMPFIPKSQAAPPARTQVPPRQQTMTPATSPRLKQQKAPAATAQRPVIKSQLKNYFAAKPTNQLENSYV